MTTMDEQQEAKRRKLEALEAKMGGAPPPQAVRPAKMPNLPAVAPTPASSAPTAADESEEQTRSPFVCDANDVVQFRLVRTEADMDAAEVFEPEFTHQAFKAMVGFAAPLSTKIDHGSGAGGLPDHSTAGAVTRFQDVNL